jgi:LPPG:FO 2-phospho-L-lactate transferase
MSRALGVPSRILPMTDQSVRTRLRTDDGWLDFQDYFVRLRQAPDVREVRFEGIESASLTPECREAIRLAEMIVIAPSNPIVSIGPILAVPGLLAEILTARSRGVPSVGVSGIVGGKALRGPADRMMSGLGEESSALGVARRYAAQELLDLFFIDRQDDALTEPVRALGLDVVVTDTIMTNPPSRARFAREMLDAAAALRAKQGPAPDPEAGARP